MHSFRISCEWYNCGLSKRPMYNFWQKNLTSEKSANPAALEWRKTVGEKKLLNTTKPNIKLFIKVMSIFRAWLVIFLLHWTLAPIYHLEGGMSEPNALFAPLNAASMLNSEHFELYQQFISVNLKKWEIDFGQSICCNLRKYQKRSSYNICNHTVSTWPWPNRLIL